FVLHLTPLDVAPAFRERLAALGTKAWVYTSATLAVGEDFSYFTRRLGLEHALTARWTSPVDYAQRALLYVPPALPTPGGSAHTRAVGEAVGPVQRASGGRALLRFPSHRALRIGAELLAGRVDYPLFVQGTMSRSRRVEAFDAAGNGVLLGTGSFWEGVDVP